MKKIIGGIALLSAFTGPAMVVDVTCQVDYVVPGCCWFRAGERS